MGIGQQAIVDHLYACRPINVSTHYFYALHTRVLADEPAVWIVNIACLKQLLPTGCARAGMRVVPTRLARQEAEAAASKEDADGERHSDTEELQQHQPRKHMPQQHAQHAEASDDEPASDADEAGAEHTTSKAVGKHAGKHSTAQPPTDDNSGDEQTAEKPGKHGSRRSSVQPIADSSDVKPPSKAAKQGRQ